MTEIVLMTVAYILNKSIRIWSSGEKCVEIAHLCFKNCLLPELMGNWYTRPLLKVTSDVNDVAMTYPVPTEDTDVTLDEAPVYCLCRGPEEGTMTIQTVKEQSENLSVSKIVQKFPIPSSSTATATTEDTDVSTCILPLSWP